MLKCFCWPPQSLNFVDSVVKVIQVDVVAVDVNVSALFIFGFSQIRVFVGEVDLHDVVHPASQT